ncbi:LIM domain-containing protein C4F6.12-like isoform X2 [Lagopus leucura]|uniref:LIM domain-containing protein C4F6.12-like isoform X2 n=1 Tax=Lagopus leucura TaxID=30410 RepID=UPI001C685D35|nr:LIM domain-containing protein C4F6.12-like isoform X2 [Lagopus leucura]
MTALQLKELSQSGLYRRRRDRPDSVGLPVSQEEKLSNMANALANAICERCRGGFAPAEKIVNSNGELYHEQCFVCAQCFQQFPEGLFYEFEGRKYCEHDFQMLFAPCCHQCGKFYIQVKYFTLITNGKSTYVAGGRCAALLYLLWEMAPHSRGTFRMNFSERRELLFLKVIKQ